MKLNMLVRFLNKELRINKIKDSSKNGLQFGGRNEVKKIGFAVDACMDVFIKAKKLGCDAVIVHHGLFWKDAKGKNVKDNTNLTKDRIKFLRKNKISLLAYHLPLDMHEIYGNNIQIANVLGVKVKKVFNHGFEGYFKNPVNTKNLLRTINRKFKTKSIAYLFGKKKIKTIAINSGGAGYCLGEAIIKKIDLYLTGEGAHFLSVNTKDAKTNLILAGHYETETFGVKALGKLLKQKFDMKTIFIENKLKV